MSLAVRKAAVMLAILAMVMRGLLPVGWMPNPKGFSETALILCDMDSPMPAADMAAMMASMPGMDMSSMDMSGSDGKKAPLPGHGHEECPFAAATHAGVAIANAIVVAPSLAAEYAKRARPKHEIVRAALYQPQSPRAPPIFLA